MVLSKKMASNKNKISLYERNNKETIERLRHWITFYRRNVELFAEHYLRIKLFPFQKLVLHLMMTNNVFVWIAARAIGKSFLTALFVCCYAILYPGARIVIVASKLSQAGLIITEKIEKELMRMSPNLRREILKVTTGNNEYEVKFRNGSSIIVTASNDNSRGLRSNLILLEEFRTLNKGIVDSVIIPFNVPRKPPYTLLSKYKNLQAEQSKKIYISSAYWKSNWMWKQIIETSTDMFNGKKRCLVAFDMYLALEHQLKTPEDIFGEKSTMDDLTFKMEYENSMIGESGDSYFKLDDMDNNRRIREPFYPYDSIEIVGKRHIDNPYNKKRSDDSIRIVTIDIATKRGKKNDNTIIGCIEGDFDGVRYKREIDYIESHNGATASQQALRIKQLYYEYGADYLVIDTQNAGITVYDELTKEIIDDITGEIYPAWTIIDDDKLHVLNKETISDLRDRTVESGALPIIFPVQGSLSLNSKIAVDFKKQLDNNSISFLVNEQRAIDILTSKDSLFRNNNNPNYRAFKLAPYVQTSELIEECINLSMEIIGINIRLIEPTNGRKDRYSSISYGNYFISLKEIRKLKGGNNSYSAQKFKEVMKTHSSTKRKAGFKFR
jgi:hypothetical protein